MKTQIRQDGKTLTVTVNGKLDYEGQIPFREKLNSLLGFDPPKPTHSTRATRLGRTASHPGHTIVSSDAPPKPPLFSELVINLENLEFVGSCGITQFIQTLKDFNSRSDIRPKYLHVRNEFKRMIRAFDPADGFDFLDSGSAPEQIPSQLASENQNSIPIFGTRKIREQ